MRCRVAIRSYWWSMIFPKTGIHFSGSCSGRLLLAAPADMGGDQRQRGRRHAVNASRLANGSGPNRFQLLPHLVRERGYLAEIERIRQLQRLVAPERRHIGSLAVQIDRVLRVDFDLLRNTLRDPAELRPHPDRLR